MQTTTELERTKGAASELKRSLGLSAPPATKWESIKCWIGLHRWFYSDSQPWRCCGRCKQEQTAHKCGASDQWVWRNA